MAVEDSASQSASASASGPTPPPAGLTLILGGGRSGKSRWAEALAAASGAPVLYVATGAERPDDLDWQQRVALHRKRRPSHWGCVECGPNLAEQLRELPCGTADAPRVVLIDSLGTWLAQHLEEPEDRWLVRQQALMTCLAALDGSVLLVAEEVGLGVVPATAVGCRFRDRMGSCQQLLMQQASASWWVIAGRAVDLRALGQPVPVV